LALLLPAARGRSDVFMPVVVAGALVVLASPVAIALIELGVSEMNLFLLLGQLGLTHQIATAGLVVLDS
jgi:hypothetical protein